MKVKSKLGFLFIVVIWLIILPGCALEGFTDESFNRSYSAGGVERLDVSNITGKIDVTRWNGSEIEIKAVKSAVFKYQLDNIEIRISEGSTFKVETFIKNKNGGKVDYEIKVPAGIELVAENVTGDISVASVEMVSRVKVVTGDVKVEGAQSIGEIEVTTGDIRGEILGEAPSTTFKAVTGDIDIYLRDPAPAITTNVTTGSVNYHGVNSGNSGNVRLSTVTGDIDIYGK